MVDEPLRRKARDQRPESTSAQYERPNEDGHEETLESVILRLQEVAGNQLTNDLVAGGARSLPERIQSSARDQFGVDFGKVRIHTDEEAERRTGAAGASAMTEGTDVYFAPGVYRPDTEEGKFALRHELAHVVQQTENKAEPLLSAQAAELAADQAATSTTGSGVVGQVTPGTAQLLPADAPLKARVPQNLPKFTPTQEAKLRRLEARLQQYKLTWEDCFAGPEEIEQIFASRPDRTDAAIQVLFDRVEETLVSRGLTDVPGAAEDPREIRGTRTRTSRSESRRHKDTLDEPRGHHGFPQYLGGEYEQTLIDLPEDVHDLYHKEVDQILKLPRGAGSDYYERLSPEERADIYRRLIEHAEDFDRRYSGKYVDRRTRIAAALRRGIREAEEARAPVASRSKPAPPIAGPPEPVPAIEPTVNRRQTGPTPQGGPSEPAVAPPLSRPVPPESKLVPVAGVEGGIAPTEQLPPARRASTGVAKNYPAESAHDPTPGAAFEGVVIALQGANFVLNMINDEIQAQRVRDALAARESEIAGLRRQYPDSGVLVVIYFRQSQGQPDSPIQPGPVFERIELGVGRDPRAAYTALSERPKLSSVVPSYQSEFVTEQLWFDAINPQLPGPPTPPLPHVGLGTFTSSVPVLQDVEWANVGGFDDEGETPLQVPAGVTARFLILQIPTEISSLVDRPENPEIKRQIVPLATRGGFPVVRLDTVIPFTDVVAVAIFPADQATADLFAQAPSTRQLGPLLIRDFDLVRWVRPEQIERLAPTAAPE